MPAQLDFSFLFSPNLQLMDRHPHSEWEEQLPWSGLLSGYLNLELTLKDRLKCGTTFVFCFCRRHYKSKDSTKHMGLQVAQYMVRRWIQPSNVLRKYQKKKKKGGGWVTGNRIAGEGFRDETH